MRLRISVVVSWRLGTGREGPLSDELDSVMAHCTYLLTTYVPSLSALYLRTGLWFFEQLATRWCNNDIIMYIQVLVYIRSAGQLAIIAGAR